MWILGQCSTNLEHNTTAFTKTSLKLLRLISTTSDLPRQSYNNLQNYTTRGKCVFESLIYCSSNYYLEEHLETQDDRYMHKMVYVQHKYPRFLPKVFVCIDTVRMQKETCYEYVYTGITCTVQIHEVIAQSRMFAALHRTVLQI